MQGGRGARARRFGRAEGGRLEPDRQRREVLAGRGRRPRGARGVRRRAPGRARDRSRHRHFAARAEADLPALLPHSRQRRRARERQRARSLHRAVRGQEAPRPRLCRESRAPARAARSRCCCRRRRASDMQRVLIVEDELHLAEGLRFNLEAEGFQAEVVDTGDGALERLLGAAESPVRSRRARRDAARQGRLHRRVGASRREAVRARPDADRARASGRRVERVCRRRGRLPAQADRAGDPAGAHRRPAHGAPGGCARRRTSTPSRERRSTSSRWSCGSATGGCGSR